MLKRRKIEKYPEGVIDWACAYQRDRTSIPNSNRLIIL